METKEKKTNIAEETITIPRAEYESMKAESHVLWEHNAEMEHQPSRLTEQWLLAKHNKYAFTSEQQEQLVMEEFGRTFNELEVFADPDAPEIPPEEETGGAGPQAAA